MTHESLLIEKILPEDNIKTSLAEEKRSRFVLQTISDSLAYSENLPIRIISLQRLNKLPSIILEEISLDNSLEKLYQKHLYYGDNGIDSPKGSDTNTKLKDDIHKILPEKSFLEFSKNLVVGFDKLSELMESFIDQEKEKLTDTNNICDKFNDKKITDLELNISNRFQEIIENNNDVLQLEKLRNSKELQLLLFLLPHLEKEIWLTDSSYSPSFHVLMNMEPLWRLFLLLWYFEKRDDLCNNESKDPLKISRAFSIPGLFLKTIKIQESPNHFCILGPFVSSVGQYNSYAFFCMRGLYYKHIYLAYLSVLAEDNTDRPGSEEINGALIRRECMPPISRKQHIDVLNIAWSLLVNIPIDSVNIDGFSQKEISSLANWAGFLSRNRHQLLKISKNNHYFLGNGPHTLGSNSSTLHWLSADVANKIYIRINKGYQPKSEGYFSVDNTHSNNQLLVFKGNKKALQKIQKEGVLRRFNRYITRSKGRYTSYSNMRGSLLGGWLQRHFSSERLHEESSEQWLGEIGSFTCTLLRKLTRADVGATLYRVDYNQNPARLCIIGDSSPDSEIIAMRDKRQNVLDQVKNSNSKEDSYCYQSMIESKFLHIPEIASEKPTITPYPKGKEPKSALVIPLYMEHRLLGILEVKGTQVRQFRWSQRSLLQHIANELAPYLYRQQVMLSLSDISRWVLNTRSYQVIDKYGQNDHPFDLVCNELSHIFLCRSAQIWLRESQESNLFLLKGSSDEGIFDTKGKEERWDGQIGFYYKYSKEININLPLVQKLIQYWEDDNQFYSSTPYNFVLARYCESKAKKTDCEAVKGVVNLYNDWLETDKLGVRSFNFIEQENNEKMTFLLTRNIDAANNAEIVGFIDLYHDRFFGYSRNWHHTIRLVNDQLVNALEQIGYLLNEETFRMQFMQHEIKEQALAFLGGIETYKGQAKFTMESIKELRGEFSKYQKSLEDIISNNNLQNKRHVQQQINTLSKEYASRLTNVGNVGNNTLQGINTVSNIYFDLQKKIQDMSDSDLFAFLNVNPNEGLVSLNLSEEIKRVMLLYRGALRRKGLYVTYNFEGNMYWQTRKEPFRRILQNLLDNVVKYAELNSGVTIAFNDRKLVVSNYAKYDESIENDRAFLANKRGANTSLNNSSGEGMGLFVVSVLVKKIMPQSWECKYEQEKLGNKRTRHLVSIFNGRKKG